MNRARAVSAGDGAAPRGGRVRRTWRSFFRRGVRPSRRQSGRAKMDIRRRGRNIPRFWQRVDAGVSAAFAAQHPARPSALARLQRLILAARRVPCLEGHNTSLYVPALYERKARRELLAYLTENRPSPSPPPLPVLRNAPWVLALLAVLPLWHVFVRRASPGPGFWRDAGCLDVFRVIHGQEWYRCLTALTLHADAPHMLANTVFACVFMSLLARRAGVGQALLLSLLAGTLGNVCNVLYRPLSHNSLGFSTALFGVVGVLAGMSAVHGAGKGRILLPLAAGAGLLASLGAGDLEGRIDYAAHIFGLLAGLGIGALYGKRAFAFRGGADPPDGRAHTRRSVVCALLAAALLVLAWMAAVQRMSRFAGAM
jgi:membrane associated rhomboid family serine protease